MASQISSTGNICEWRHIAKLIFTKKYFFYEYILRFFFVHPSLPKKIVRKVSVSNFTLAETTMIFLLCFSNGFHIPYVLFLILLDALLLY